MKQWPGQSIQDFYSEMVCFWDEIAKSKPRWDYLSEADKFYAYCDSHRLIQFLMALLDEFDSTQMQKVGSRIVYLEFYSSHYSYH